MRSDKFGYQLKRKNKTWFFTSSTCIFLEPNETKFWYCRFHLQNQIFCRPRGRMKMNFDNFQTQKFISQTELKKQMKNGFINKVIYLFQSKRRHHAPSENSVLYRGRSNSSWDIEDWNIERVPIRQKNNKIY